MRSGRVGLARICTFLEGPVPLSVSPMIQRTVSPAATGPEPTSRRGIDLVEGTLHKRIDLHRIDVAIARRLHAGGFIGRGDPDRRIFRFRRGLSGRQWFQLAGQRQRRAERHDFDRPRRIGVENGGRRIAVIVDQRRLEGRTGGQRAGSDENCGQRFQAH